MKPFLILQLRPETEASDSEYAAFLNKGGLREDQTLRIRLDQVEIPEKIDLDTFSGVIVGGGPGCVSDAQETKSATDLRIENSILGLMPRIVEQDMPFLGCCYGIGILAHYLGGRVDKSRYGEPVGPSLCALTEDATNDPLACHMPDEFHALVGHKEALQDLPPGCVHLVASETCPYQMIRYGQNVYATQFHPEADAAEFETRIRIYKDHGYFAPEDAQELIENCKHVDASAPQEILRGFVQRYG